MAITRKQLTERWSKVKSSLNVRNIDDPFAKENTAVVLENHLREDVWGNPVPLNETGAVNWANLSTNSSGDWKYYPITLAMVRRTFPELLANKVVGVQAMNAPVGYAFALRYTYDSTGAGTEAAWDSVPEYSGFSGNGVSALTNTNYYGAASGTGTNSGTPVFGSPATDTANTGFYTSAGEKLSLTGAGLEKMNQLGIRFDRTTIEAQTRKLAASYTIEASMDVKTMQGIDLEKEMLAALQYEIIAEQDRELLFRLRSSATNTSLGGRIIPVIDCVSSASGITQNWGGQGERFANIAAAIQKQANDIATSTNQGAGNFVIVSPAIATVLQLLPSFKGAGTDGVKVNASTIGTSIGTLFGTIDVYRDRYAKNDYALVGFKGSRPTETGVIFCPYVMGLTSRAMEQDMFQPRVSVMNRYAIVDNLLGTGRYYRLINFTNVDKILAGY